MRKQLVIANWKVNGSMAANQQWMEAFASHDQNFPREVVVCAPFVYLTSIRNDIHLRHLNLGIGAQNVSPYENGAYTGEVSAAMLKDIGMQWCIVGHSERRSLFGESNDMVAQKALRLVEAGIKPVICLGETLQEREDGKTLEVVNQQLLSVLKVLRADDIGALAYEPVWAIGTGRSATPQQAQEVHAALRETVASISAPSAQALRIVYGGSVKSSNAMEIFSMPDIDGGLIGGASLQADEFINIANTCLAQNF